MGRMCGFAGITDNQLLHKMCDVLWSERSANSNFFMDDNVGMGLRNTSANDKIVSNEDRGVHVCLDGEIYHFKESLPQHVFDAEKIAELYGSHGINFVEKMRRPFTVAILDANKRQLILIRDRVGQRPLFYASVDEGLVFGSEIKCILQHEGIKKEIDLEALDYFFAYSYIPAPLTIFKGIKKLPPSCVLQYDLIDKHLTITRYWEPDLSVNHSLSEEAWTEALYEALREATLCRLEKSEAPLGGLLSGGVDSSVVLAVLRRLTDEDAEIMAFTTGFGEQEYDETDDAREVAEFLGLDHHVQIIDPDEVSKYLPKLVWHLEEPFGGNAIAHLLNFEFAKKFTNEVFNGDGGDEAFYYPFYQDSRYAKYYQKLPEMQRQKIITPVLLRLLPAQMLKKVTGKLFGFEITQTDIEMLDSPVERAAQRVAFLPFQPQTLSKYFRGAEGIPDTTSIIKEHFQRAFDLHASDFPSVVSYVVLRTRLPDCMIRMVERLSSAAGIVVRSPLLDIEIIKMAASIPSHMKIKKGRAKYILRRTAEKFGLLPKDIISKEKVGFPVPIEYWLKKELKYLIAQMLESEAIRKHLKLNHVKKTVRAFERSTEDHLRNQYAYHLWSLIMFEKWYEMYIENNVKNSFSANQVLCN